MPTDGILTGTLRESKTNVLGKLPKIDEYTIGILIEVCTIEELTGICTLEVEKTKESKIVEVEITLTAAELDSSIEEVDGCSSVDEVVDTSIRDT